jgi:hypothetical protein
MWWITVLVLGWAAVPSNDHWPGSQQSNCITLPDSIGVTVAQHQNCEIKGVRVDDFLIVLDSTELSTAVDYFGAGSIEGTRSDGQRVLELCYQLGGETPATLVLESGAIGAWKVITGFSLKSGGALTERCASIQVSSSAVTVEPFGVRLGMLRADARKALGTGIKKTGDDEVQVSDSRVLRDDEGSMYSLYWGILVRVRDGSVHEIEGWRNTSW